MRFEALTFLRFIAAAVVVLFHFGRAPLGLSGFLVAGPEMVTFFFVLSGFVMGVSTFNKNVDKTLYWWSRAARIVPVYWIAIAFMVATSRWRGEPVEYASLLLNLTLLQAWLPEHALTINAPGWSLSVEAFFYLTFPLLVLQIRKVSISPKILMLSALMLWLITQVALTMVQEWGDYKGWTSVTHGLVCYLPISHYCSFMLGLAGSQIVLERRRVLGNDVTSILAIGCASALVVEITNNEAAISSYVNVQFAYGSSLLAPIFLLLIVAIASATPTVSRMLSSRPLVLLGECSFSLYILQFPVYLLCTAFVAAPLRLGPVPAFLAYFVLLVAVSLVSFVCFERPVNTFLRDLFFYSFRSAKGRVAA